MVKASHKNWSRGVILDLDDTLYLEQEYVASGYEFIGRYISQQTSESPEYGDWLKKCAHEKKDGRTFNHLLDEFPSLREKFDVPSLVKLYREHIPQIELKNDWLDVLRDLKRDKVFLGLISDGELIGQQLKMDALGIGVYFDHIILTDAYGKGFWKPHSRAFEEMQAVSGLSGRELVYVGDNVLKDFVSPNELGWRSVRLRLQGQVRQHLEPVEDRYAAEETIETVERLKTYLDHFLAL